jgi:hypothetical protein
LILKQCFKVIKNHRVETKIYAGKRNFYAENEERRTSGATKKRYTTKKILRRKHAEEACVKRNGFRNAVCSGFVLENCNLLINVYEEFFIFVEKSYLMQS